MRIQPTHKSKVGRGMEIIQNLDLQQPTNSIAELNPLYTIHGGEPHRVCGCADRSANNLENMEIQRM